MMYKNYPVLTVLDRAVSYITSFDLPIEDTMDF
jgi:hypothetical protein